MRTLAAIFALMLAGCATPEQIEAEDRAKCLGWGATQGTPLFAECMVLLANTRAYENRVRSDRLIAAGTALQSAGAAVRSAEPDGPPPSHPGITRSGSAPGIQCRDAGNGTLNCYPF